MDVTTITQEEYDKLLIKSELKGNTMYFIEDNNTTSISCDTYSTWQYNCWKPSDLVTYASQPEPKNMTYVCQYCGTHYIANAVGFIPNCKNCGATMEREE